MCRYSMQCSSQDFFNSSQDFFYRAGEKDQGGSTVLVRVFVFYYKTKE